MENRIPTLSEIFAMAHAEGEGDVTFTRLDGKTVTFNGVLVDSIGPTAANPGVIAVEFFDSDRVVHVPFVLSWEVDYRP